MTKSNLKGFTLIELLIVIVIVGILAVALIPRLTGSQATARDTAKKATLQQIATVISAYVNMEQNPVALTTWGAAPTPLTTGMATQLSGYGNISIVGPNNAPIYIAKDATDNDYVISVALEKGNGNVAGTGAATAWFVPGPITSAATGYAVRTP